MGKESLSNFVGFFPRISIKVIIFQDRLSIKPRGLNVFDSGSHKNEFVKCNDKI